MGNVPSITLDKFPQQSKYLGRRVEVFFYYDVTNTVGGVIVRDDGEAPYRTVIKLDDDRYILGSECQYRILP